MQHRQTLALAVLTASLTLASCGGAGGTDGEASGTDQPNNPQTESPVNGDSGNTPDTETPDTETPDTETPDTETPDTETPDTETPAQQQTRLFSQHCDSGLRSVAGPQMSVFDHVANVAENEAASPTPLVLRSDLNNADSLISISTTGFPNTITSVCSSNGELIQDADAIAELFDLQVDPTNGQVQLRLRKTLDFETDAAFYQLNLQLGQHQQKVLLQLHDVQQGTSAERLKISSYNELKSFFDGEFVSDNIGNDIIELQYSRLDGGSVVASTCPASEDGSNPVQNCSRLHIALDRDIDASASADSPWQEKQLVGSFDGQQYVIENLTLASGNSFITSPTRFTSYSVNNLGMLNINFDHSVFSGAGSNNLTRVFISGTVKPGGGNYRSIIPFATGGSLDKIYSNIRYDLTGINNPQTQFEIGGLVGGTSSPLSLGAGYSNGAVITDENARFVGTFAGMAPSSLNEGFGFGNSLFYSAMAFNVSTDQGIRFQDDNRRVPYFSVGGIGGRYLDYPGGEKNSAYSWRFISDRSGNTYTPVLGNGSRDTNNDGIADEFANGPDVSAAGLTQAQARQAANFTGPWANGVFDIRDGEYPVLKGMPYPHIAGASWMSAEDPGVAYQRLNYDRYLVLEDVNPEPANNGDSDNGDDSGNGTNPGDSSDNDSGNNSGDNSGGDNSSDGNGGDNNGGNGSVEMPAAVNNCNHSATGADYQGDGPNPDNFACVINLAENTTTSAASPYQLRLTLDDENSVMKTLSLGFPNRISRVRNDRGLDISADDDISEYFGLSINPLNGEVGLVLNKELDFEQHGAFFRIELSLGSSSKNILLRVHDIQYGNTDEALKISSYNELKSFFDGEFVSENIGFDIIDLKHIRLDGIVDSSCDTNQPAAQNCSNMRVELDRDIDASASADTPWEQRMLHGSFNGQRFMIRNLTLADNNNFLYSKNRFSSMAVSHIGFDNIRMSEPLLSSSTATVSHVSVEGQVSFPAGNFRRSFAPFGVSGSLRAVYSNLKIDLTNQTQGSQSSIDLGGILIPGGGSVSLRSGYSNGIVISPKDRDIAIKAAGLSSSSFLQWFGFGDSHLNNSLFYSAMAYDLNTSQAIRYEDASRRVPYISVGGLGTRDSDFYPAGDHGSNDYNWRFITNRTGNTIDRLVGNIDRDTDNDGMADSFAAGINVSNAGITEAQAQQAENFSGRWLNSDFDITDGEYPVLKNMPYPRETGASWLNAEDPGIAYQRATFNKHIPQN